MVFRESRSSNLSASTISFGRRSSPTLLDKAFLPTFRIGVAVPYPTIQQRYPSIHQIYPAIQNHPNIQETFLLDATPPQSPARAKPEQPSSVLSSSTTVKDSPKLLAFGELPQWAQDNVHIHHGYRPISNSVSACLRSCTYRHTETFNVWSHLIPCILFIILEGVISYYLSSRYPKLILKDHVIFAFFLLCASLCLGISAIFHSLTCHSEKVRDLWLKLDFAGILLLILGCSISAIYMTFYCEPTFHYAYWGMIIAMSTTTMVFLLLPSFQGPRWRSSRVAAFIATSIAVLIPFVHAIALFGFSQSMEQSGMPYYFAEAVLLLVGVVCYAKRWPESWLPGYFDYLGNSHQIFHILVVLALALHLVGLLQAFDYNYQKGACGVVV